MKVYVTGSSRGLGRAIKKQFSKVQTEVIGLDRPEYNLDNIENYIKNDFDIYVNNAEHYFAQTCLLYALFETNKNRPCHIINIGSVSSDGDRKEVNEYAVQKTALEKACTQLTLVKSKCKVSLLKPGRMRTDMVKHIDAPKLDPREVARAVLWIAAQPEHVNVKSLSIDIMETS